MDASDDSRALDLFERASELEPEERAAFLRRQCQDRPTLLRRVRELLSADMESGTRVLSGGVGLGQVAGSFETTSSHPERLAGYHILGQAGVGGMGIVFEAEQESPRRRVALKVLRPLVSTPEREKRFRREAEILGRLQYSDIARVYDSGTFEIAGVRQPYLAMEFVDGVDLISYADREGLDLRERLELLARVADAIDHAHSRSIVHRDLKPDNVLVDGDGNPKVLDFGIARISESVEGVSSLHTMEGQVVGTLAYMAPEQARGSLSEIGPETDVYGLGTLLHELVCGRPPVDTTGLASAEAMRRILDAPVPEMSRYAPDTPRDVQTIVSKALERSPSRRYARAGAMAADLRRFLERQPISARPLSGAYKAQLFVRRNPVLVGGLMSTTLAVLVGVIGVLNFAQSEARARRVARRAELDARRALYSAVSVALDSQSGDSPNWNAREQLDLVAEDQRGWEWHWLSRRAPWAVPGILPFGVAIDERRFAIVDRQEVADPPPRTMSIFDVARPDRRHVLSGISNPDGISNISQGKIVIANNGEYFWAQGPQVPDIDYAEHLAVFDIEQDRVVRELPLLQGGPLRVGQGRYVCVFKNPGAEQDELFGFAYVLDMESPETEPVLLRTPDADRNNILVDMTLDGCFVAYSATAASPPCLHLFDAKNGDIVATRNYEDRYRFVAFSGDGELLASIGRSDLEVLTVPGLQVLARHELPVTEISRATSWGPSGVTLTAKGEGILIVDPLSGEIRHRLDDGLSPAAGANQVIRSTDGRFSISRGRCRGSWVSEIGASAALASTPLEGHESFVYQVAFSPDGSLIASAAPWNHVRIWDAFTGELLATFERTGVTPKLPEQPNLGHGHVAKTAPLFFVEDGRALITIDTDQRVVLEYSDEMALQGDDAVLVKYDLATGGTTRLEEFTSREVCEQEVGYLNRLAHWLPESDRPVRINSRWTVSADHGTAYSAPSYNTLWPQDPARVLSMRTAFEVAPNFGRAEGVGLSPNEEWIAITDRGSVRIYETRSQKRLATLLDESSTDYQYAAAWSPDQDRLAVGGTTGTLSIVETEMFRIIASIPLHDSYIYDIAWSPDGTRLGTASGDGTVRLLDSMPLIQRKLQCEDREQAIAKHEQWIRDALGNGQSLEALADPFLNAPEPDDRLQGTRLRALMKSWTGKSTHY